jgi:hypothetical protein
VSLGSLGLDCVAGIALAWQEKLSYQLLRILNTKTNFQHWVKRTAASEDRTTELVHHRMFRWKTRDERWCSQQKPTNTGILVGFRRLHARNNIYK